ncbi:MAG: hypothetical protein JWQ11_1882 [Rhizobacter sp.]|nr:hypothetical protein [Rhizobacter sp.]
MKERLAGFGLMTLLVPLALVGWFVVVCAGCLGKAGRARAGVRALDHFVNAAVLDGHAWESVSSHAWRARERAWAKLVIRVTDAFQQDHCRRANKREQPVVDLVLKKGLHHQTIR